MIEMPTLKQYLAEKRGAKFDGYVRKKDVTAYARRQAEADLAAKVAAEGYDKSKPLKTVVIELRLRKLTYKWISKITGASYGYVRNACQVCGLTNEKLSK